MSISNYDKSPSVPVPAPFVGDFWRGWGPISAQLRSTALSRGSDRTIIVVECYSGVHEDAVRQQLAAELKPALIVDSKNAFKSPSEIDALVAPWLGGDDPVFGFMTSLHLDAFLDVDRCRDLAASIERETSGIILVVGPAASLVAKQPDVFVYADMARWEAQMRQRRNEISNLGVNNHTLKHSLKYKRSFFVDWRVCDRLKQRTMAQWDFLLDTCVPETPKLITGKAHLAALAAASTQPFRVVPFFDPGPWGGQWMKDVCDLDRTQKNFAWCFDCVPEENSLLIAFGDERVEIPSINLVFNQPKPLLGEAVYGRFGPEFPIRFDFLDTIKGGNLSFQVHPLTEYARERFGLGYTQDESYYMLDAEPGATVYLGHKNGADFNEMIADLEAAQRGEKQFDDAKFAARFPAKKHDHFLIPAGTLHCSGAGAMVLEISATPYIFTFKLWDWNRLGLDGKPRPVHIHHGKNVIQWERDEDYARRRLINQVTEVARGDNWIEERTGLHEAEFIETRRHWFTDLVPHDTAGNLNVLNLIEGVEAVVESPTGAFKPFVVHYAETFIVPAAVGSYTIRPHGASIGSRCGTIKAFVRKNP
jgi:mannose-6-phosphate isomerase class I